MKANKEQDLLRDKILDRMFVTFLAYDTASF